VQAVNSNFQVNGAETEKCLRRKINSDAGRS